MDSFSDHTADFGYMTFRHFLNLQQESSEEKKELASNATNMEESGTPYKRISAMTTSSTVAEEHHVTNEGLHNDINDVNSIDACSRDNSTAPSKDCIKNVNGDASHSLQPSSSGRCIGRCFPYLNFILPIKPKHILHY